MFKRVDIKGQGAGTGGEQRREISRGKKETRGKLAGIRTNSRSNGANKASASQKESEQEKQHHEGGKN